MNKIKELGDLFKTQIGPNPGPDRTIPKEKEKGIATPEKGARGGGASRPTNLLDPYTQVKKQEAKDMTGSPTVMDDVKAWLMTKCRDASTLLTVERQNVAHGGRLVNFSNIVVTPENIPPFTIPRGEGTYSSNERYSPDSEGRSQSSDSLTHSSHTSPGHSPCATGKPSSNYLSPLPSFHTRSAPVSPSRSLDGRCGGNLVKILSEFDCEKEITNADPFSRTALSLPHLKTKTDFGFETLSESPHTRRKESLFHSENDFRSSKSLRRSHPRRKTTGSVDAISPNIISENITDAIPVSRTRRNKRRDVPSVIAPLGVVLVPNSHGREGRLFCSSNPYETCVPPFSSCPEFAFTSNRRNIDSLTLNKDRERHGRHARRSSLCEDLESAGKGANVSKFPRRNSNNILLTPTDIDQLWGASSSHSSSTDISSACSCRGVTKYGNGSFRLSLQYIKQFQQLKVGIIRAENLGGFQKENPDLNTLVKLYLMPGKLQKQVSRTVKGTKDPVYDQDFVFNGIEPQHVSGMKIHMKVYQKSSKLAREELMGELQVALANFELSNEIRILKALDPPMTKQELGYIQVAVCFYASAEKLTVTIHKVTDLAKNSFTGAPDPYVKVELLQPGRQTTRFQTKTRKKTTASIYDETFTFTISPKIDDIKYTSLDMSVMNHGMIRADGMLGQIRLGYKATEEAEFTHWNQVLQNPGKVITSWHMLMEPADP